MITDRASAPTAVPDSAGASFGDVGDAGDVRDDVRQVILPPAETPSLADRQFLAPPGTLRLTYIGAGTVLCSVGGFTILTDPTFLRRGRRAPLGYGLHATRQNNPSLAIDHLPPLDAVVLSHYHGDHFDRTAEMQLPKELPIITTPHAATILQAKGFGAATGLETWQSTALVRNDTRLRITSLPGNHRPGLSRLFPPVMGTMWEVEAPRGSRPLTLYHTGDTLLHDALKAIPERFPAIDLMLPHLGGTRIFGLLLTMDAAQGVRLMELIRPTLTIPIHFGDYDIYRDPLSHFQEAVRAAGLEDRVQYIEHGETQTLALPIGQPAHVTSPLRERQIRPQRRPQPAVTREGQRAA